ncbi:MAG: CHAT domain-containing protein [Coleofasciculus sp. A1-SPW-01]
MKLPVCGIYQLRSQPKHHRWLQASAKATEVAILNSLGQLYNVNDASTAELMSQFYQKYLQENLPPAEALRQAQLAMWQSNVDWQNPYYWAAFTLQGEWH